MGNTGSKPSVIQAKANEDLKIGDMTLSSGNGPGGNRLYQAWQWTGEDWIKVSDEAYSQWQLSQINQTSLKTDITIGPIGGDSPNRDTTLRWPKNSIDTGTDYVFFQFGKYVPPFSREAKALFDGSVEASKITGKDNTLGGTGIRDNLTSLSTNSATYDMYNSSASQLQVEGEQTIMLPMPQDLSTESNQQWQGKQFTATGRAAVAALAAGQFSYANEVVKNIAGNATALQTAFNTSVLNSIPGVGGNIEFNDVSGATRGIVINPNAELLYDSPEMREVGMIFKMVPRNYEESLEINKIVKYFRSASMPSWGSEDVDLLDGESTVRDGAAADKESGGFNLGDMNNWIHVPKLCKFTFMTGSSANKHVIQYKACAISGVEVNYTPDGTWSSYNNMSDDDMHGSPPVAVELRLNFMETKLIFANEVGKGF